MKLLHILPSVDPATGGPLASVLTADPILRKHGCTSTIVSLDIGTDPWVATCPLPVFPQGRSSSFQFLRRYGYAPDLIPFLRREAANYDAVCVHGLWSFATWAAWRAFRGTNIKYFVYPHGMLDPYFNRIKPLKALIKQIFWWAADGPLTNHATATLFVSKEEMRLAPQSFWPYRANAQLMPFGIQDVPLPSKIFEKKFRALCPELADRNYLLFLSRLHPKKGCDLLLHAFVALNPPDVDLVLAGPDEGQKRLLEALAKTLGVSGRVHFPGMLQGDAKWGAYYGADVFILPSHQENFGLVVAEALACSLPVLTTNKVATAPIVASNFAGFVGTDDLAGIKAIIQTYMLLSSQDKERLSQNARQAFTKYFDVATLAPQMLEVFNQTNK